VSYDPIDDAMAKRYESDNAALLAKVSALQSSFEDEVTKREKLEAERDEWKASAETWHTAADNFRTERDAYNEKFQNECASHDATIQHAKAERDGLRRDGEKYRRIAWLIGSIFVHGKFKAETHNETELEKLLRETGNFWESIADFDAALQSRPERRKGERRKYTRITADRRQAK
jgi:hypothetical protein